jgi:hypothetical protein
MPQQFHPDLVERRGTGDLAGADVSPAKFDDSTAESISQSLSALVEVSGQNHLVQSFNVGGPVHEVFPRKLTGAPHQRIASLPPSPAR